MSIAVSHVSVSHERRILTIRSQGSHILLNLRRFSHRSYGTEGTTLEMELLGSIEFAGRSIPVEDWMSDSVS